MEAVRGDIDVNDDVADHVSVLWQDACILATFEHRAEFKIEDSSKYFFDEVRRIASRSYIPSDQVTCLLSISCVSPAFHMSVTLDMHAFPLHTSEASA